MSEMFYFEVPPVIWRGGSHWVQGLGCMEGMGKTFPVKLLQELHSDMSCIVVGIVIEKDDFLCEQARCFL
jgi:hypothetical protein